MKRGFTLVELLAVIAIIVILAAILLPVLSRAREKARQMTCMSNQRQIVNAVLMYAQDYDFSLPGAEKWTQVLAETYGATGKVWDCPTTSPKGTEATPDYCYSSMLANRSVADVEMPEMEPVTADGAHAGTTGDTSYTPPLPVTHDQVLYTRRDYAFRHHGGAVVSYLDGHVAVVHAKELRFPYPLCWVRADYGVQVSAGLVSSLLNIGGADVVAGGTGPAYVAASDGNALVLRGGKRLPFMRFGDLGPTSLVGPVITSPEFAIFAVVRNPNLSYPGGSEADIITTRQSDDQAGVELQNTWVGTGFFYRTFPNGAAPAPTAAPALLLQWFLVSYVNYRDYAVVYINGGNRKTQSASRESTAPLTIGDKIGGSAHYFRGSVAEVIALDYAPETPERRVIERMLLGKYTNIPAAFAP